MADEIELHFVDPRPPEAVLAAWRSDPPPALRDGGFRVVDESYNSLTWERHFLDWPMKIMVVCTLGMLLLLRGLIPMETVWRVTTRFADDGETTRGTRVTVQGKADERTRHAFGETAAQAGGTVGLRVGA